jgi:hypothetical protein
MRYRQGLPPVDVKGFWQFSKLNDNFWQSLGTLAPLYTLADLSLTYGVIGTLLKLKDKVLIIL